MAAPFKPLGSPPDIQDRRRKAAPRTVTGPATAPKPRQPNIYGSAHADLSGLTATPPEPQWATPEQIMERARQLAQIQQQPNIDALNQQSAYALQVMNARLAQQQQVYGALGGLLKGVGPAVQGTFNQGAASQTDFAKGFSHGMQLATQGSADQANALLKDVVGAPAGQQIPASQSANAADVLMGVGGTIPAEQFKMQGAGMAEAAQRFPLEAQAQQHMGELGAQYDYQQQANAFAQQLADLAKQNPLVVAQYLDELYGMQRQSQQDYYGQQQDAKNQAMSLYNAGFLTQRQLATQLGLPNANSYPNVAAGAGGYDLRTVGGNLVRVDKNTGKATVVFQGPEKSTPPVTRTVGGDLFQYDQTTGGWSKIISAPVKQDKPVTKTVGGYIYQWNPKTGAWQPVAGTGPTTGNYQHVTVGGKAYTFDPGSGTFYDPATNQPVIPKNSPAKGVIPATIAKGRKLLGQIGKPFYATTANPFTPLSLSELNGVISNANAYLKSNGKPLLTLGAVYGATPAQLAKLGIAKGATTPSQAYLGMVQLGVPARRAWQMVRAKYPQWGKGFFSPKGEAPAGTGAGIPTARLAEAFYDPLGSWDNGKFGGPIGGHSDHVHLSITNPQAMLTAIQTAQAMGLRVGENPYVGQVHRVHVNDSFHYRNFSGKYNGKKLGEAIDVSGDPAKMAAFYRWATGQGSAPSTPSGTVSTPQGARQAGQSMAAQQGWTGSEWQALDQLWTHESGWDWRITNRAGSGATGIPQALPARKMASAGADWQTNPLTQIKWGLSYVRGTYRTPSRAWAFWQATVDKDPGLAPPDLRSKARQWISKGYTGY